ncbi:unnamed protein product [Rotaria sordida]|uniref:Retinoblastoma-binding protein 6 n=1 Tax=Rotaria sordida TaxID=392033 RepID=A0A813VPY3_9BILA|nr:unnamed protein product [Rotaria sordida]
MSIIRYRFKADKNFESVKIDGMNCSLGELKRLIAAKSSRSGSYYPKDDYDLIISNANTHEEYKDNSDLIPRNASVIVARRIRGSVDTLTPFSNQKLVPSSDDVVKDFLMPAILHQNQNATMTSSSSAAETNSMPLKKNPESTSSNASKAMTEDELIKEIQMGSQARYVTPQPSYRTNLFVCHNCKQPGHIKSQCPLILQSSGSAGNASGSSSSTNDGSSSTSTGSTRQSGPHSSHIVTRHAPYSMSYHHRGNRSHRGAGHPRGEPLPKKTTGIPRDRLIPVPKHIPGALRDQTGASVVPRQMAELYVERIEKKTDSLAQIARQTDEKGVLSSVSSSSKSIDNELPPNDLLCPLCKRIYADAVITPCCNLSFCDECIRTALIESPEHECPHCHCQHVAIDQINPNLYLRNHIKRWHERQNQSSYSHMSISQQPTQTLDQDVDTTTTTNLSNSNEIDEYDSPNLSTNSQQSVAPIKAAPIIIKMQPLGKSQSPQPIVSTRPADMTFEDEKISDIDQTTSSQKDVKTIEETIDIVSSSITPETEKLERESASSHVAPVNTIYSSPSLATTIAPSSPVIPHYYPVPQHHNVIYPHHIPPTTSNGLYPIQPNYYPPPLGVRYPAGGIHHFPQYAPAPPIHHHPPPPPPQIVAPPHIPTNGYNMPGFHPHPTAPYTSTSTFIAHHQTATQPISTALSENEFYIKQRYFQRIQRSPSRRRSRSSSYSSYSSSDSRSSSRSRYNRRRRSSRSRSRHRVKSPVRDNRRQRRSSSYRNRRRPIETKEKQHSSKYRRSPPRPARDHERRRSPRPPPTIQQSTQRTIVYLQESSHSSRDRRRTKSRSRENDDRINSLSKKEQQTQSESKTSSISSPTRATQTTLSSKIETVVEETLEKVQDDNSKNGKKHKKHKKHRHSSSKGKKHHRSKDKEKKTIVDTTTSVIEIHS